ncbi:hypothetical protein CHS0354_038958 [Potamilus streckersoni]|uniref:VWFD domain-containing protein n=1 Tax=Potamilus streckersoni TaxID=2493646 RepID=A0AAE0S1P5_9BIVA|nr:hypothetical protein CHS0354_038958 [Potamilus streckersoni]
MASSQNFDPCDTHMNLQEKFRSVGYHVDDPNDSLICDRTLTAGWYKFTSNAGGQMPESCVQPYHCGTHAPIWMNGAHPTVAEGIVTREACGNIAGTCCMYKTNIKVKNCGVKGFVYELQPTRGCSLAYCAGTGTPCRPDQYSLTGLTPCTDAYPKLPQNPQISNPIVLTDTFEFQCKVPFDTSRTDVKFEVTWLFNSKPDPTVPLTILSGNDRLAHLDQHYLKGHLGESISCAVSSYFLNSPQRKSPKVQSPDYWMGIRIEPAHLVVGENDPEKDVKLVSTIPIVCATPDKSSCKMEIYLDNNNHQTVGTSSCTQIMRPSDWNSATNQAVVNFKVLAQRDFKNDGDQNLVLHFNPIFSVDVPNIWNNYQIPYLQVQAKDKETSICSCVGDPHCITLDQNNAGKSAYHYFKVGEFLMYKSTSRPFEVHARTVTCNKASGATCNCAVAAREGNDQVIIDLCHHGWGQTYPRVSIQPKDHSQGTVVQKDPQGHTYYT